MIKSSDMFLKNEGQQLDFSSGLVDLSGLFNDIVVPTINGLLTDTGAENDTAPDPIKGGAERARQNKQTLDSTPSSFGFESTPQTGEPTFQRNTSAEPIFNKQINNSTNVENQQLRDFDPAEFTFNSEARKDSQGRLSVFTPPSGDGGGSFEVAGITAKFQPEVSKRLKSLIRQGRHGEAEVEAKKFFRKRAAPFTKHASQRGLQLQLADTVHHRGEGGLRQILQRATGSKIKDHASLIKKLDSDPEALNKFNKARVDHELINVDRGRSSRKKFRKGLLNRFANANKAAQQVNQSGQS